MQRYLSKIVRAIDRITHLAGNVLALLILAMIGILMYEVVARYFFNRPTSWALQLSTMVFGTYMICGGGYALLHKAHVSMDMFYARWSKRTRAIFDSLTYLLFFIVFTLLLWKAAKYGLDSVAAREHSNSAWGQPLYHWKMTAPLGFFLLLLQGTGNFIRSVVLAVTGKELN